MKYAHVLLTLSLSGSIAAACSATGGAGHGAAGGGAAGGASSSAGGSGPGASSSSGATTSGSTTSSGAGTGGTTSTSASGSGGAVTVGTGGQSVTATASSSGTGVIDFDGGWQIPDAGTTPPLIGDGGTTVEIGPGADAGAPGRFGGSATGGAITLVYPANGVILPPNTNTIEFHFIPAPGQTLFELTFHAPTTNLTVYTGCTPVGGGCVYTPDTVFWQSLVAYARGTSPVTYSVKGVNGSSPGAVGSSPQQTIAFADQDITGGIFYWNTAGVIERYDFGYPSAPAETYLTPAQAGALFCVGCHVLSREGTRIAVGADIPSPAPYKVYDTLTKTPLMANNQPLTGADNFFSFSPDEQYLLTSDGVSIGLRDLQSGAVLDPMVAYPGAMPDWAPDGLHLVYAKPAQAPIFNFAVPGVSSAALVTMHFNGVGWDNPVTLVPFAGQNNYYPAYSPDGAWIVFNRSPSNAESFSNAAPDPDAGTVPDGELWVVAASGGTPVRLSQASDPGACSWPKWAPVVDDAYSGKILWLTFASARAYGLRLAQGAQTQLWMMGFDPQKAAAGQDPSFPAFWLPFQDMGSGNHIAQWATKVPRRPCTSTSQCDAGETCRLGVCAPD